MSLLMLESVASIGSVDRENNVIYGAAVIRKGKVNDSRGWVITDITLDQVVEFGNAAPGGIKMAKGNIGVKSRFDHPTKNRSGLGAYLGVWKNFRRDGDVVRADLYISPTAFKSPIHGDIATYVLDLAEEAPQMFGVSIAAAFAKDFDGLELKISGLKAVDIVDQPAGTDNGMFSTQPTFEAELSELIDVHFTEEAEAADTLQAFLSTHFNKGDSEMSEPEVPKVEPKETPEPQSPQLLTAELGELDTESIKEQGRIEERNRVSKITSLCTLSECPEKAAELIKGNFTYDEAKGLVDDLLERKAAALSEDGGTPKPKDEEDPDAKYKAQYEADKAAMGGNLSVSEEDYIASLKISESGGVHSL